MIQHKLSEMESLQLPLNLIAPSVGAGADNGMGGDACVARRPDTHQCPKSKATRFNRPLSCRDRGKGGEDVGALCLSSSRYDPSALWHSNESDCDEDRHKAPTHPPIHPLSLQDAEASGCQYTPERRRLLVKRHQTIISYIIAVSIAIISLFAFALPVSAHPQTNAGQISGQLQDGTKRNAPVAGQTVTLQMAQGQNASDLKTVTTDARGMFSFSGLNTDKTISYAVYTLYQKAQYVTDLISLSDKPLQRVNLQVYDTTGSIKNIAVVQANILIDKADAQHGLLNITESFVFENLGLTTYVGSLQANGQKPNALRFSLPVGARQLSLKLGFDGYNVVQVDPGFASDASVPPGQSQFAFSFQVPYSASHYDFAETIVYPTVDLSVLTPLDYRATSGTLASQGTTNVNQQPYQQLQAKQLLPGAQVHIELDGLPASTGQSSTSQADQSPPWFIPVIVLMLAIVATTWFVYIRLQRKNSARRKKTAKSQPKSKTAVASQRPAQPKASRSTQKEQETLLQAMLELDKVYETGTIKKAEYQERRATMKSRLRDLISTETGEKKAAISKTVNSNSSKAKP